MKFNNKCIFLNVLIFFGLIGESQSTPLSEAAKSRNIIEMRRLVSEVTSQGGVVNTFVSQADDAGKPPLFYCIIDNEDIDGALFLLENGADPNAVVNGTYLIHYAVITPGKVDILRQLLKKGVEVDQPNAANVDQNYGYTALHFAARQGDPEKVRILLLEGRANLFLKTPNGLTALQLASDGVKNASAIKIVNFTSVGTGNRSLNRAFEGRFQEVINVLVREEINSTLRTVRAYST